MDDEVSRLLARTRARREALNCRLKSVGEEGKEIRSPLKERNREVTTQTQTSEREEFTSEEKGSLIQKTVSKTTEERVETRKVVTFAGKLDPETKEELRSLMSPKDKGGDQEGSSTPSSVKEPLFEDEKEARKKRLAGLAAKFNAWEDDSGSELKRLKTPTSEIVDVDSALQKKEEKQRPAQDPSFMKSLKAQGFQETSSKSKLVYDFNRRRSRSVSPVKSFPPVQVPQTRNFIQQVPRRSPSPSKPHPLQFVSPPKPPPPKPARTYAQLSISEISKSASENNLSSNNNKGPDKSDTASRRTLLEKKTLFESASPQKSSVDPALLSLHERKALFEKNKTVPRPIARFGESVTPAMLSKAQARVPFGSEPAWKRKREGCTVASPTTHHKRRSISPSDRASKIEAQKKLFENTTKEKEDWRESDLARQSEENKKKDMDILMKRFITGSNSKDLANGEEEVLEDENKSDSLETTECEDEETDQVMSSPQVTKHDDYPGVHSLKKFKVSPPKEGCIYPHLETDEDTLPRSEAAMSVESFAPSEAPSLGTAIQNAASAKRASPMPSINENEDDKVCERMNVSTCSEEIDDILDEALDDSELSYSDCGPTPPKVSKSSQSTLKMEEKSPTTSTYSWEFEQKTPYKNSEHHCHDFKTPLIEGSDSPGVDNLPQVEGVKDGLFHTVSFYRKSHPLPKIVRNETEHSRKVEQEDEGPEIMRQNILRQIRTLQEDAMQQEQRMEQSSKALNYCVTQDEFEGSYERVEGERLLLEAFHKYSAAMAEVERLKTEGAMGKTSPQRNRPLECKGSICISGIILRLKTDFIKVINSGVDDFVHYFVCLVKYKNQVVATQMLSSVDGISKGRLHFPNLINVRELDFDFQVHLEVYALQTRKEILTHEAKYHIRKDKSVFNLTPLRKLKRRGVSRLPGPRHQNPVNSKTIRRPAFGKVGHTTISLDSIKMKKYYLHDVPPISPLEKDLNVDLTAHSENKVEKRGFLTLFTDVNGFGDWNRRWCLLSGNSLRFWKYPEDEMKEVSKYEINLSACITENVTLAPREICSRMNTFTFETQRPTRSDDKQSLIMHVNRKSGLTRVRHLVMADTRDERIAWCNILNGALVNLRAWDPTFRPRSDSESSGTSSYSSNSQYTRMSVDESVPSSSSTTDIW